MIESIKDCTILSNGVAMPWLGFGVFGFQDGHKVRQALQWAFDSGYRSIDTASVYGNEQGVGQALKESGIPRKEIFLTTKVWNDEQGYDSTLRAFEASLEKLQEEYVDLYLVHWPVQGKYRETWQALENLYKEKRVRAIGVSNFMVHHLKDLLACSEIKPMVNQVEFHPRLVQPALLEVCRTEAIQVEAWSPLMKGKVMNIPELVTLGKKYGKSPAQVTLRWNLQHEVVTIPTSTKQDRIISNADIFDFELSEEEMAIIDQLDHCERIGPDPDNFNF